MSYRHPSEEQTKVHIATKGDWDAMKVYSGLKPLCGVEEDDMTFHDVILSISDLDETILVEDEYLCPFCLEHEDYPLLVLANS